MLYTLGELLESNIRQSLLPLCMPIKNTKSNLHPRNKHRQPYDFEKLIALSPSLENYVEPNKHGNDSINFFDPEAVKALNSALLKKHYGIQQWDIPKGYLCPPVPGRVDYIHYVADLLAKGNKGKVPKGLTIKCLDIGVGSNCIYPMLGAKEYGWSFVGADIDKLALKAAQNNIDSNDFPKGQITLRWQDRKHKFFNGIIQDGEQFDVVLCNPPFHRSAEEARKANLRKLKNLRGKKVVAAKLNFGGSERELWCEGGELQFILKMLNESKYFAQEVKWFTTLVSKQENVRLIYKALKKIHVKQIEVIEMGQGQKQSRIVAWRFSL